MRMIVYVVHNLCSQRHVERQQCVTHTQCAYSKTPSAYFLFLIRPIVDTYILASTMLAAGRAFAKMNKKEREKI